jgi:hypothetical protein
LPENMDAAEESMDNAGSCSSGSGCKAWIKTICMNEDGKRVAYNNNSNINCSDFFCLVFLGTLHMMDFSSMRQIRETFSLSAKSG